MWKKYCGAEEVTDDNITRRMHIACWIPKATNTHSEYVILTSFPPQQCLRERASVLCSMYSTLPVLLNVYVHYRPKYRRALTIHTVGLAL